MVPERSLCIVIVNEIREKDHASQAPPPVARGAFKIEEGLAAAGALEPSKCSPIVFHVFAAAAGLLSGVNL